MNMRNFRAGLIACLLAATSAAALSSPAMADTKGPKVSAPVGKLLEPAQKALAAKQWDVAMALIKQAQALPDQTDDDKLVINEFLVQAAIGTKDYTTADTAIEAVADSPSLPDADKLSTYHNAVLLANQYNHLDKAIKYGQAYLALAGDKPDPAVLGSLAQAYFTTKDYTNAPVVAQKAVDMTPAGQPPNRAALQVIAFSYLRTNNMDAALKSFEQTVTWYDDKDMWSDLINFSVGKGFTNTEALHVYRLRLAVHASGKDLDYTFPASIAMTANYPGEALAFLDAGRAAGVLSGDAVPGTKLTYSGVSAKAAQDRGLIGALTAVAHKAATGDDDMKLAETLIGYGRYGEAEAAAREALQKGGAKVDANEANMVLGESLALEGKTADAVTAFGAVSDASPGWSKAKHLWLLFANRKYGSASN